MSKKNTGKKGAEKKGAEKKSGSKAKPLSGAQAAALVDGMKAKKAGKAKAERAAATPDIPPTVEIITDQPLPTPEKKTRAKKEPKPKRTSALDAAAQVLQAAGAPMRCKEMIEAMTAKGLWTSPGGKTPEATLYSAILREVATKGTQARFKKIERGQFAYNG